MITTSGLYRFFRLNYSKFSRKIFLFSELPISFSKIKHGKRNILGNDESIRQIKE